MRIRICAVLVIAITLFGFPPETGFTADNQYSRKSLKGIKGVTVLMEDLGKEEESDGLSKKTILNDIELRLRQNGIKVFSENESYYTPGSPYLYIHTTFKKINNISAYVYAVNIELGQDVTLNRSPIAVSATTWSKDFFGLIPIRDLNSVREHIKISVDVFINAYFSVNPKK
jgi:hypothetical protein